MRRRSNGDDNRPAAAVPSSSSSSPPSSRKAQASRGVLTTKKKQTSDSRLSTSSSTSSSTGFQSFFRWFKRSEKEEGAKKKKKKGSEIHHDSEQLGVEGAVGGSLVAESCLNGRQAERSVERRLDVPSSSSSSCDSVFSTATNGFAFISPVNYNPHGPGEVAEICINPGPETETYRRRVEQRQEISQHQSNILSLKKKYGLYGTSETLQSENHFPTPAVLPALPIPSTSSSTAFSDLSLPTNNRQSVQLRVPINQRKQSTSHCDLIQNTNTCSSTSSAVHRRTWSECSIRKNKRSPHVRGKRPAPAPPGSSSLSQSSSLNRPSGSSTYSTLARSTLKKRRAPPPPYTPTALSHEILPVSSQSNRNSGADLLKEINEAISRNASNSTPEMDHIRYFVNEQRNQPQENIFTNVDQHVLGRKNTHNLHLDITKQEVPGSPRLSPISPRPWYKRPVSGSREPSSIPFKREVILRTVDKRRKKKNNDEEKLPEFNFMRNSRFGIFSRNKEAKKLEQAEETKRRSGIGMPNISELDREAKQIINSQRITLTDEVVVLRRRDLISDSEDEIDEEEARNAFERQPRRRRKSAKELISQFEAKNSPQQTSNRVTSPVPLPSNQLNAEGSSPPSPPTHQVIKNSPLLSSVAAPLPVTSKNTGIQPDVVKLTVSERSCAVTNDEETEQVPVKVINGNSAQLDASSTCRKDSVVDVWKCPYCTLENPNWRILCQICERIKPYENKSTGLIPIGITGPSKKYEPTDQLKIDNWNLDKKTDKVKKYFMQNINGNSLSKSASETSVGGNLMTSKKFNKSNVGSPDLNDIRSIVSKYSHTDVRNEVVVNSVTVIHDPGTIGSPVPKERKKMNLNGTPDLEEVRHARLNHFKPQMKDLTVPIMITDKDSLDRERQRLKDKIRAMNAKATSAMQKTHSMEETYDTVYPKVVAMQPKESYMRKYSPDRSAGAIKKCFKETEEQVLAPKTTPILEHNHKADSIIRVDSKEANVKVTPSGANLSEQDNKKVKELAEQLKSLEGREEFKATLKYSEKTGTIAINRILKSLELAIMDGEDELAAKLAKDLAKMRVSLSVTRQRDKEQQQPKSEDEDPNSIGIQLLIENNNISQKSPIEIRIIPEMTVLELKEKIQFLLKHPISMQKLIYNDTLLTDHQKTLKYYQMTDNKLPLKLFIVGRDPEEELKTNRESSPKKMNSKYYLAEADQFNSSMSDDENDQEEGAIALPPTKPEKENPYGEIKATWTCPLCTLINTQDKLTCGACSKTKPVDFKITEENKKTPIQLKKFSVPQVAANNLNRPCGSRLEFSNDLNIRNMDKRIAPSPPKTAAKLTEDPGFISKALGNPNITRNRYRGVDNYNPKNFLKGSSPVRSQIPVKRNSTPKSPKVTDKNPLHLELLKLDNNKDVVENTEPFECPICFGDCEPGNGVVLRDCLHSFCRECLSATVEHNEEVEIKCPFMDKTYSCDSVMQEREIRAVVTEQIYEKHLMQSIRLAENKIENAFHCKTPNCRGWCIYEDNVNMFRCPVCSLTNCLTCQAIHDGLNCKQYQDQMKSDCNTNEDARRTKEMLEAMVTDGEAMNCPTCQVIVMKKWGCDWLKCSMCKTEICWITRGPRWGPGGKGDITEGCKCGVFGKKCHAKCTYCH